MKKQQKLIPLNSTSRSGDEYEWERFRQIKARFLQRFVKARTKKQLMVYKGKFLEQLVRLAFKRLNYKVRRYSGIYGDKGLDFEVTNQKKKRILYIEVTNWARESYPHSDYKPSKMRAFKDLARHVRRLWIVSYKESLDLIPQEEIG